MQNWFATLVLILSPLVILWLYKIQPAGTATIYAILGSYMLLPVGASIKIAEGIPQFDRVSIPALAALFGCRVVAAKRLRWFRHFGIVEVAMLVFLLSPLVTIELNRDPIVLPNRTIPGETFYDGLSAVFTQFIVLIPFLLGRELLRNAENNKEILIALVLAGLLYSVPMLIEIRLSPQLHNWIYGYFPSQFAQTYRFGGYRPVVFMGHGLLVAFFTATTVMAATALLCVQKRLFRLPMLAITMYLAVLLILCKSFSALIYGIVLAPLIRWTRPRFQLGVAVVFATLALLYPLLRTADLVPTNAFVNIVSTVSEDRASSLQYRFDSEKQLLDRASERVTFGWGRFGRSRIYSKETGQDLVFTDGLWVLLLGGFGLVGFFAEFGLLTLPIYRAASAIRFAPSFHEAAFLAALALIMAANLIDLLPNSTLNPWSWLLAGALLGRAERLRAVKPRRNIPRFSRNQFSATGAQSFLRQINGPARITGD
jgi:hypothetical protein